MNSLRNRASHLVLAEVMTAKVQALRMEWAHCISEIYAMYPVPTKANIEQHLMEHAPEM
jgi:hypothetical protein